MGTRYRIDPNRSRFIVHADAAGVFSVFAHSPTFAVQDYRGDVAFEDSTVESLSIRVTVVAESLTLEDRVSAADRDEIETRMRRDVLETSGFPEVVYRTTSVAAEPAAQGRFHVQLQGELSLHGVTRPHTVEAELLVFIDGVSVRGESRLRLSDHRIKPVTALAGAIKLKDELKVVFDLVGIPEGT